MWLLNYVLGIVNFVIYEVGTNTSLKQEQIIS